MLRRDFASLAVASLVLGACGSDPSPTDAGPRVDGGASCGEPDTSCPASLPHPGAPCATGLACEFPAMNGTWMYACPAGRWEATSTCTAPPGGTCPIPPLAETCDSPFAGTLEGGTIEVGPAGSDAFRPYTDGEMVSLVYGGQGSPMIHYRVRVNGVDAPGCVRAVTTLTAPVVEPVSEPRTLRLRCGESLGIFTIVTGGTSCPDAPVDTQLEVEITGVGTATADITVPPEAFCPALPG